MTGRAPVHLYTLSQLKRKGLKPRDRRERATLVAYNADFEPVTPGAERSLLRLAGPRTGKGVRDGVLRHLLWQLVRLPRQLRLDPLAGGHHAVDGALMALECAREMAATYEREYAGQEQS